MRNVPDGLAVMFSLPIGLGFTPAISQLETAQPIATSVDSSIETSMNSPLPVRAALDEGGGDGEGGGDAAHRVGDRIADAQAARSSRRR